MCVAAVWHFSGKSTFRRFMNSRSSRREVWRLQRGGRGLALRCRSPPVFYDVLKVTCVLNGPSCGETGSTGTALTWLHVLFVTLVISWRNIPLWRQRCRRDDKFKIIIRGGSVDWIHQAHDKEHWRAVVNTEMNLQVAQRRRVLLTERILDSQEELFNVEFYLLKVVNARWRLMCMATWLATCSSWQHISYYRFINTPRPTQLYLGCVAWQARISH
jgi:hypothetical protein